MNYPNDSPDDLLYPAGETSFGKKKPRNAPHYKEMYESCKEELAMSYKVKTAFYVFAVLGWLFFAGALVYIIIMK